VAGATPPRPAGATCRHLAPADTGTPGRDRTWIRAGRRRFAPRPPRWGSLRPGWNGRGPHPQLDSSDVSVPSRLPHARPRGSR